ncbi:uncharacterized protein PAE49_020761 [Odontesthes bonariensis]|uniref:uncharacterized protein LOC142367410 n=1 Tax=Odontesthes bonariensis TaxID=219752 RepID=UPI003F58854C
MSSFRFLSLNLLGGSLLLLLTAVCEAQEYGDFTPPPDYDTDYNATFEYSFYSNASSDDLDKFSEQFIGQGEDEDQEGKEDTVTGGQQGQEDVTVTMATTRGPTERSKIDVRSAASPPVSLEFRTLVWTLFILMVVKSQQL